MKVRAIAVLLCLTVGLASHSAWAEESFKKRATGGIDAQQLDEALVTSGWKQLGFKDVPSTEFRAVDDTIRIEAPASNALIYRELEESELTATHLDWSWRVDSVPPSKPLNKVARDDRAIALYVAFEIDQRNLSLWGRIRGSLVALFSGLPKGQVLTYVWGTDDAIGKWFANPYIKRTGRMKVLRNKSSGLGEWQLERVDLVQDFTEAFGYAPIKPVYIALSADTEDSEFHSLAWVRGIHFDP